MFSRHPVCFIWCGTFFCLNFIPLLSPNVSGFNHWMQKKCKLIKQISDTVIFGGSLHYKRICSRDWDRERKKSVGGKDICFPPAQRMEDQGVETGVSSTLAAWQGPWKNNDWQTVFFSLQFPSLLGGREVVGGTELFWNCRQSCGDCVFEAKRQNGSTVF